MPQFTGASLAVNDGSATPVAVQYYPEQLSSTETVLVDRREASRDMQPSVVIGFSRATPQRATYKITHDIAYPLVRTVNGTVSASNVARAKVVFTIPTSATSQERAHLRALLANLEDAVLIKAGIEQLDPLY